MINYFLEGLTLNASLILGLGAQNILVLNAGLKNQRPLLIAFVCTVCDIFLISIGVLGVAKFFLSYPLLKIIVGCIGILFLAIYAIQKIREGLRPGKSSGREEENFSKRKALALALSLSLLNPHVYLDTIILIGGFASKYAEFNPRLYFGIGACFFSTVWFFSIALLGKQFAHVFKNPKRMAQVNLLAGIVLLILSIKLGFDVKDWIRVY